MSTAIEVVNEVRSIPLDQLHASLKNPRQTMDEAGLQELAASIRELGIISPLLVRPRTDLHYVENGSDFVRYASVRNIVGRSNIQQTFNGGTAEENQSDAEAWVADKNGASLYEIVCGHRRSEAATIAGLTEAPCIVREMSDEEAADQAFVDNLQRVDVPPLEEAEAFGELLDRLLSIPAVAAKVGKEQSYVAKRLKLRELTVWSQDALRKQLITIDHALLLARLASAEQNEALKWCLDTQAGAKKTVDAVISERLASIEKRKEDSYYAPWEPESVVALKRHIERESGELLERAPWPMEEDYLLPDAGSCLDCEKNTKANAPLFGDLAIGEPTCTDGVCFKNKTVAWVEIKLRESGQDLNAKQKKHVPRLSWKFSSVKPATCFNDVTASGAMSTTADPSKVLKAGQWIEAKKNSCPNVRGGVTANWSDANDRGYMGDRDKKLRKPGETLQVCIASGCKVHKKGYEETRASAAVDTTRNSKAYEEQEAKRKQARLVENQLRMGWAITAVAKVKKLPEMVLREALEDALDNCDCDVAVIEKHLFPKVRQTLNTAELTSVAFAQALAVLHIARNGLNLGDWSNPPDGRNAYIKALKQLGTDPSPAWDEKKPAAEKKVASVKTPAAKAAAKKSILSPEAKKRIADAQKKRWADAKKKGAKK